MKEYSQFLLRVGEESVKAILVDDEQLALERLKLLLEQKIGGIEVVAIYLDCSKVISGVMEHRPDVVFLDIQMPQINGLDLGRRIQAFAPSTEIVFVTGYDKYAVRAFELYALDFIMKPVQISRLEQTILRIREKMSLNFPKKIPNTNAPVICCFNQLRFKLPGQEAKTIKWRTNKAQELFAYLLHHRDRTIDRSVLLELLWPDYEEAKAAQQLYNTTYYIRQALKSSGMDTVTIRSANLEAGYRLEIGEARIDTEEWERSMKQLGPLDAQAVEVYEEVLSLFEGNYLGEYEYIWAEHERERFRLLWLHYMKKLGAFYEQQGRLRQAVLVNQRIQQLLPDEEESYFSLMRLYDAIGNEILVEEQFLLFTSRFEQDQESLMNTEIREWYDQWKLCKHEA